MQKIGSRTVTIPVYERVPVDPPATGWRREQRGTADHVVEIVIDVESLFRQLGPKAAASKGGKSVEVNGAIVCRRMGGAK